MINISKIFSWLIGQVFLAAICYFLYKYLLFDLFEKEIAYHQWIVIIIISACVLPGKDLQTELNAKLDKSNFKIFKNLPNGQ